MRRPAQSLGIAAALLLLSLVGPAVLFAAGSWTLNRSPTRAGAMWWSVRADANPLVYVGGYVVYPTNSHVHLRNLAAVDKETGNVVWDLYYAGQGFGFNNFYGLTSDDTSLYAVGYEPAPNNLPQLIVQKHDKTTGQLIWTVRKDPTPYVDLYYRAYLRRDRLYVVGTTNGEYHDPGCPEDQQVADWIISAYDAATSGRVDFPLDRRAQRYTDTPPPTDPFVCYTLLDFRAEGATRRTDLLCVFPRTRSGENVSQGFSVLLARSNLATLGWAPPGGHTDHLLVPLGTSRMQVLPPTAISTTDDTGGVPTCYALFARSGESVIGNADVLCAVPGFWADL